MKVLLDTNIVIHRENIKPTNFSIGQLFYWIDRLHYDKVIHPYTVDELRKFNDGQIQKLYDAKLSAYILMKSMSTQSAEFSNILSDASTDTNDLIDNQLLYEVYCGRVDMLITEDRRLNKKAEKAGISDKVFTINSFITKCVNENPELIEYNTLSVKKELFANINIKDIFFDTFRNSYQGFDNWFIKKSDEEAYVCRNENMDIIGFLYLKTENESENYADITPVFSPKKRLKVGTFKVEASGFRLGERFIKIIFDNAIERNVDEIYVTLFTDRPELRLLYDLLVRWGFVEYGIKKTGDNNETVMVKKLNTYNTSETIKMNFPNVDYNHKKFFLPIEPQYHTPLLPDSQLKTENEVDFMGEKPHRYALQKVYISFSYKRDMAPGDLLMIYRKGTTPGRKAYESVVSTIAVIDEVKYDFSDKDAFMKYCENRTVFSKEELESFWRRTQGKLLVIKFIQVKSLNKRLTLKYLWDNQIIAPYSGPRPFDALTDEQFDKLISDSNTDVYIER